jgi:hypothetical protein
MTNEVIIDGDVLEADAEGVWQKGSDTLLAMADAIPDIAAADFSGVAGGPDAAKLYHSARQALGTYIRSGAEEFLSFEERLLRTLLVYAEAARLTQEDVQRIRTELVQ